MSQRIAAAKNKRRRSITLIWIAASAAVVFLLIWKEQTALLYVLATLGVTILLFIVAVSDIGHMSPSSGGPGQISDAQASSSGIASTVSPQKQKEERRR